MTQAPDDRAIQDILAFWFADETKERWYDSTPAFDQTCGERFGILVDQAANDQLSHWADSAAGALALCLLLDQMPRNLFRGSPRAFATDAKAVDVAEKAIAKGYDQQLHEERRKFLYLPFMHSEVLVEQERSVALSRALGDENTLSYALEHADIIKRFGRFPHRNAILGRKSTMEEVAFLKDGARDYGQSSQTT